MSDISNIERLNKAIKIVDIERNKISKKNRKHYDIETHNYLRAMLYNPESYNLYAKNLWTRIQWMKRNNISHTPINYTGNIEEDYKLSGYYKC